MRTLDQSLKKCYDSFTPALSARGALVSRPVNKAVENVKNDGPKLLAELWANIGFRR